MEGNRRELCVICDHSVLRQRQRHLITHTLIQSRPFVEEYIQSQSSREVSFDQVAFVCHRCWQRINHAERARLVVGAVAITGNAANEDDNIQPVAIPDAQRNLARASNTASHCIFRGCSNESRLRIPNSIKVHMLSYYNFYIPPSARVCNEHIIVHDWEQLLTGNVSNDFDQDHILDIISIFRTAQENPVTMFDFDLNTTDENELKNWTGLTIAEFQLILDQTPTLRERSDVPNVALGGYLMKLRTGEPNIRLASLLKTSRRTFERRLVIARECLLSDFVPLYLGFDYISRNAALTKNLLIPNAIFGAQNNSKLISICDGTYSYIQKSSNFLFQRRSYSLHKHRPLLKPFLIVCSNGYIIDVTGPHAAVTSDATIMSNMLNNDSVFHWFYTRNDVFILDRGFRDALPDFEICDYEAHMPPSKDRHSSQLSTEQANKSRLITIVRWVVDIVNGRFKRDYNQLRSDNFNTSVPHMFEDFRIAAALINMFHIPISDNAYADAIITIINERKHMENHLAEYVIEKNLNRQRVTFMQMAADVPSFEDVPRLEEEHLVLIALGTYHIKLARSYCAEHLRDDGRYIIELYRDDKLHDVSQYNIEVEQGSFLLRGRIQSRHARAKKYYSYILINRGMEGDTRLAITIVRVYQDVEL